MRADAGVCVLLAVLAIVLTWPLVTALDRAVIYPDDPYINTWILDWDWYATLHQPLSLFEANLFFPAHDALAFSEHLYGIALPLMPLRAAGISPLAAHNVGILLGFVLSGIGMYVAARAAGLGRWAAFAAAVFYAFVPFRFTHLHHIQYVWSCWPPLLLAAILWYAQKPSWPRALLFGAAFFGNGLTNVYWFFFASFTAIVAALVVVLVRDWWRLGVVLLIAIALLSPFLYPYVVVSHHYAMERTWEEVRQSSATIRDWFNPGELNRLYRHWADVSRNPECWLFPGLLGLLLTAAGLAIGRKHRKIALVWVVIGVLGSFGVHTFFFRFLFSYVPGFHALRVPSRWANMAYVGMGLLIAISVDTAVRRRRWAGPLAAVLLIFELRAGTIPWYVTTPNVPQTYQWLKNAGGPAAEWPMDAGESEYSYVRWATVHHQKIVNGVSGFAPPEFERLAALSKQHPLDGYIDALRGVGVRYLIIHGEYAGVSDRADLGRLLQSGRLKFVARCDHWIEGDWIFSFDRGVQRSPALDRFLTHQYTYNTDTFGLLNFPPPEEHVKGAAQFSGWALSPYGVKKVDLLLDTGRVRIPTELRAEPSLHRAFPWYPATTKPRFVALLGHRPHGVHRLTNVQVEITDGRDRTRLLEGCRFTWD